MSGNGKHSKKKKNRKNVKNKNVDSNKKIINQEQIAIDNKEDVILEAEKIKVDDAKKEEVKIENKKEKKKTNILKKIISNLFLIVFLLGIALSIYEIVDWAINNKKTSEMISSIENVVTINNDENLSESEKYNIDFEKLKTINKDTIGWLKVKGTDVEYPVVQGKDNSFYLNHSLDKTYNAAGWIFADCNNSFGENRDKNTVIYGHNRRDGSMFCSLKDVLKPEWYENEENRMIMFITENEKVMYETFSVYNIEEELYYVTTDFSSEEEFGKFINTIESRSIVDFDVVISNDDEILTLSTCANNNKYRVVLHAKRVTEY